MNMSEIIPNGSHLFTQSFTQKMAQNIVQDFEGRSMPDDEFSFDGWKISGFEDTFGGDKRWIRPQDKNLVFQIILSS